jgi:hypothetical protein
MESQWPHSRSAKGSRPERGKQWSWSGGSEQGGNRLHPRRLRMWTHMHMITYAHIMLDRYSC